MKVILKILDRLSDCRALVVMIANGGQCSNLMSSIQKYLNTVLTGKEPFCIDGLIRFLKKISSYENSHEAIIRYQVHELAVLYL